MMKRFLTLKFFRNLCLEVLLIGGAISLTFMFKAVRNNDSVLLKLLFLIWVASPFVALTAVHFISRGWSAISIKIICILMLVIATGSLIGYAGLLSPHGSKPAFIFLVVPLVSWLLMAVVMPIVYRKRNN
jgi:hypothetical protein